MPWLPGVWCGLNRSQAPSHLPQWGKVGGRGWPGIPAPSPPIKARQLVCPLTVTFFLCVKWGWQHLHLCIVVVVWHNLSFALKAFSLQYILFQAISPRDTFKNSDNVLIVVLKIPQYIFLVDNNALLLMNNYWSQGWMSGSVLKIS